MRAAITVTDKAEAERIRVALEDRSVRAFVNVWGVLMQLEPEDRIRVLNFTADKVLRDDTGDRLRSSASDLPTVLRGS